MLLRLDRLLFCSVIICGTYSAKCQNLDTEHLTSTIIGVESIDSTPIIFYNKKLPFLEVKIGSKNYTFLFDTGSELCILSTEISKRTKGIDNLTIADLEGNTQDTKLLLADIQINNTTFKNIKCIELDLNKIFGSSCTKIDGVIGQNLINKLNWHLNTNTDIIYWSITPFEVNSKSILLNIEYYKNFPLVKIGYDNLSFYALMDTGFDGFLEFNMEDLKISKKYLSTLKYYGFGKYHITIGGSKINNLTLAFLDSIKFGNSILTNIPTYITKGKPLIGSNVLTNHNLTLNFSNNSIVLNRHSDTSITLSNFGFNIHQDQNNKAVISFVWKHSNAYLNGLRVGQKISKINNINIDNINQKSFCELMLEINKQYEIELEFIKRYKKRKLVVHRIFIP